MLQTLDDIWMHFLRVRETSVSLLLHHVVAIVDALLLLVAVSAHSKPKKGRRRIVVYTAARLHCTITSGAPLGSCCLGQEMFLAFFMHLR